MGAIRHTNQQAPKPNTRNSPRIAPAVYASTMDPNRIKPMGESRHSGIVRRIHGDCCFPIMNYRQWRQATRYRVRLPGVISDITADSRSCPKTWPINSGKNLRALVFGGFLLRDHIRARAVSCFGNDSPPLVIYAEQSHLCKRDGSPARTGQAPPHRPTSKYGIAG